MHPSRRAVLALLWLCAGQAVAQPSTSPDALNRRFVQTVAPTLDGTRGLTLEALTSLVTTWVRDVRSAGVTTLEPQVEQGVAAVERFVAREAARVTERCTPGAGADNGWAALDTYAFSLRPGLVGDFTPLHTALTRCLSFKVIFRSEISLQHPDMDVVVTTATEATVPVTIDLRSREGSGQGTLNLTRTEWAFTNGCAARITPTAGLLCVEALGVLPGAKSGPFAPTFTEYSFRYKLSAPGQRVLALCPPGAAEVPGTNDFTWSLPYQLAHRAEYSLAGHYLPPLGSHEPPLGPLLNQWTWRQEVPGMVGATEFTTLKVRHAPR